MFGNWPKLQVLLTKKKKKKKILLKNYAILLQFLDTEDSNFNLLCQDVRKQTDPTWTFKTLTVGLVDTTKTKDPQRGGEDETIHTPGRRVTSGHVE